MRLHTNGQRIRIRIRIRLHNAMREEKETNKRGGKMMSIININEIRAARHSPHYTPPKPQLTVVV